MRRRLSRRPRWSDARSSPTAPLRDRAAAPTVLAVTEVIFERIAPVVRVHDLDAALARYRRLGFMTELDERSQYGFARRGAVQLHLVPDDPDDPDGTGGVVYVYVSDANALHAQWASAGVEGRFLGPHDTPYGLREFVYTDTDGIVHRVGSRL